MTTEEPKQRRVAWEWTEVHGEEAAKKLMGFERRGTGPRWWRARFTEWVGVYIFNTALKIDAWRFIRPLGGPDGARPDRTVEVENSVEHALVLARSGWQPKLGRSDCIVDVFAEDTRATVFERLDAARAVEAGR